MRSLTIRNPSFLEVTTKATLDQTLWAAAEIPLALFWIYFDPSNIHNSCSELLLLRVLGCFE